MVMGLRQLIEFVQTLEKELALINIESADAIEQQLTEYFETQNVRISSYRTSSGTPEGIAVLSTDDAVLEVISIATLRALVDSGRSGSTAVGVADEAYDSVLDHLKETTFTSYDTEQMLYASREIEDRARRVGDGTVHAQYLTKHRQLA